MTEFQWNMFCKFKEEYKALCNRYSENSTLLFPLQKAAALKDTPDYPFENAVVYNTDYDKISRDDDIKIIVIGDNPGKEEQLNSNQRYLVGQSGRIADGFFKRNPELETDFRRNVIIMNKTPVHTAKTTHLKYLYKNGSDPIKKLIDESQKECARLVWELHKNLGCQLWLVGYSELKTKGIFGLYREELKSLYESVPEMWDKLFVFQHFSMNRFLIDLKSYRSEHEDLNLSDAIYNLGHFHRDEIFS